MGYLRRLILVNSAGYPLADVRLDGHCDIAGGQGVGKTTLMNAILFPFVAEDRFIDIDRLEKQRFSLYYFPSEMNSFVIYEVVNNKDIPYCIFIHRTGGILYYHFISAPFNYDWIYEGEEQVKDWQEVREKLNSLGIPYKTEDRRERFNNIFLGKGAHYHEQYSIVKTNKDKDAIRPLLSAIFRNLPFTQETLKNSLVAAVMSSNQLDNEGIDLASHRRNLDAFAERYSDIQKMTEKDKNGKTVVGPVAEVLLDAVDRYYFDMQELKDIPGRLKFAYESSSKRISTLSEALKNNTDAQTALKSAWGTRESELQEAITEATAQRKSIKDKQDEIAEIEAPYKEFFKEQKIDIETLVDWCREKKSHEQEHKSLLAQRDALTADSKDISAQKDTALEKNRLFYQNEELKEKKRQDRIRESFQAKITSTQQEARNRQTAIEKEYKGLLGENWRETEGKLIDALVEIAGKLSSLETVCDIQELINNIEGHEDLSSILSTVLTNRVGEGVTVEKLRKEVEIARKRIQEELDRKEQLEKEKSAKLEAVKEWEKKALAAISEEKTVSENEHASRLREIKGEHDRKTTEIADTYDTKIHGNDESIKEALTSLNEFIAGEKRILDAIEKFPAAIQDKALYFDKKESLKNEYEAANLKVSTLQDTKKEEKAAYESEWRRLDALIETDKTEKGGLEGGKLAADKFLESRSAVKAAYEAASVIDNDKYLTDIISDYTALTGDISDLKDKISKGVQRLYEPGMLSRVDTFQLGIGLNDSLSNFDDFLGVAEKLRTRLENSEEGMGMDKYIRINSDIWLNEIKDIDTAMSPVESMLLQISRLCRQASRFVQEHNTTDCIDYFSMSIDESDTTDVVKLMREISDFYKKNNTTLGTDNLFAADDDSTNKMAKDYLSKFADILNSDSELKMISLSSMFNVRMDITEKGNVMKNLLSFNNPGSRGTAIVLKAMLNMTLLHIVLEKNQAANTRLICAIDEMNTIEARNLDALTDFATAAGMFIIGSGQHHTKSALDYSYNVWDERSEGGKVYKYVSMDAMGSNALEV